MSTAITYQLQPGTVDVLVFDAVTRESPTFAAVATEHPVEEGADVSDHVRPKPVEVTLEVTLTDYPLSSAGRGINGDSKAVVGGGIGTTPFVGRSESALGILQRLKDTGAKVIIESGVRTYTGMVLTSIAAPRDRARYGAVKATLQFRQLLTVASEIVPLAKVSRPVARPDHDAGHHEGHEATDGEKTKSWLAGGADGIGAGFGALKGLLTGK